MQLQLKALKALISAFHKYKEFESMPFTFENGMVLYPSEVMTLKFIRAHAGDGVTTIASALGVSKAAVSQTVTKLVKKGLITKEKLDHDRVIHIMLSEKGHRMVEEYSRRNNRQYARLLSCFEKIEEEDVEKFLLLMDGLESVFDQYIDDWK